LKPLSSDFVYLIRPIPQNYSFETRLSANTLLNRAKLLATQIRKKFNKTDPNSNLVHYYYRDKVTNKMVRKRSIAFVKSLKTNRLIKILEQLSSNFDLSTRVYRYVVWKILPNILLDIALERNIKLIAIASLYVRSYLGSYWNKGKIIPLKKIKQTDNTLLSFPACIPRLYAYHLKWTTKVDPPVDC